MICLKFLNLVSSSQDSIKDCYSQPFALSENLSVRKAHGAYPMPVEQPTIAASIVSFLSVMPRPVQLD